MDHRDAALQVKDFFSVPEFETGKLLVGSVAASMIFMATVVVSGVEFLAWRAVGILFLALLILMTVAVFTDFYTHQDKRHYPWSKAIARKVMIVTLVVVSLVLDMVVYETINHFPQDFMFLDSGYLFVTMTTCIWLIAAELTCVLQVIEDAGEEDTIPPTLHLLSRHLKWMLKSMKFIDRNRVKGTPEADPKHPKRWYDDISDEEIEQLAEFLQGRRYNPPGAIQPTAETKPKERPLTEENRKPGGTT